MDLQHFRTDGTTVVVHLPGEGVWSADDIIT